MAVKIAMGVDFELCETPEGGILVHTSQTRAGAMCHHELDWLKERKHDVVALLNGASVYAHEVLEAKAMSTPKQAAASREPATATKSKPTRTAAKAPAFLIVRGRSAFPLSAVKEAHRVSQAEVVLVLTGRREIHVYGTEAADAWKVIESHRARACR